MEGAEDAFFRAATPVDLRVGVIHSGEKGAPVDRYIKQRVGRGVEAAVREVDAPDKGDGLIDAHKLLVVRPHHDLRRAGTKRRNETMS